MERRNQQSLDLIENTPAIFNDGTKGQNRNYSRAGALSWQMRIGLRGQDKKTVFSNLMKHINYDTLHEAFTALDGNKAVGVDGIKKSEYALNLDGNLKALVKRVQRGTYRPLAKREVLIPEYRKNKQPLFI